MAKTRMMYMHLLDGHPASYFDMHGNRGLAFASTGHRTRAAVLVPTLSQIRREQAAALRDDWGFWNASKLEYRGAEPSAKRYSYVLVRVPV